MRLIHGLAALLLSLLGGCDEPESLLSVSCPESMVLVDGGTFVLGQQDLPGLTPPVWEATVYQGTFELESFCIDPFPFPGVEGAPWPEVGLSAARVEALEVRVAPHGRRLCSVSELLLASAGPDNWHYPYDPESWVEGACDPDDLDPAPLGSYEDCISPVGVRDFQVRSTWGRLDLAMKEHVNAYGGPPVLPDEDPLPPESFDFAVQGGTSRSDTFYSPTNFGLHSHPDDHEYIDDGVRLCADPATAWEDEEAYLDWLAPALAGDDVFTELDPS